MSELDTALVRRTEDGDLSERDLAIFALQDRIARQASQLGRTVNVLIHDVARDEFDAIDAQERVVGASGVGVKHEELLSSNVVDGRYYGGVTVSWFLTGEDA